MLRFSTREIIFLVTACDNIDVKRKLLFIIKIKTYLISAICPTIRNRNLSIPLRHSYMKDAQSRLRNVEMSMLIDCSIWGITWN